MAESALINRERNEAEALLEYAASFALTVGVEYESIEEMPAELRIAQGQALAAIAQGWATLSVEKRLAELVERPGAAIVGELFSTN